MFFHNSFNHHAIKNRFEGVSLMVAHDNIAHTRLGKWCEPVNNTIDANQFVSSKHSAFISFGFHDLPAYYAKTPSKLVRSMVGNIFCYTSEKKEKGGPIVSGIVMNLTGNQVITDGQCPAPSRHFEKNPEGKTLGGEASDIRIQKSDQTMNRTNSAIPVQDTLPRKPKYKSRRKKRFRKCNRV